jgi:hypothetical protein
MGTPADEAQSWYEADMYAENLADLRQAQREADMEELDAQAETAGEAEAEAAAANEAEAEPFF